MRLPSLVVRFTDSTRSTSCGAGVAETVEFEAGAGVGAAVFEALWLFLVAAPPHPAMTRAAAQMVIDFRPGMELSFDDDEA
jgi:hypothetical protein